MKVSDCIEMYDALAALGSKDSLPGRMAYRIAKNVSLLKPIYDALNDKKNEWLKTQIQPSLDGSYKLEGKEREDFINYMQPILDEPESLPEGIRKLNEGDIPTGVESNMLVPLVCIIVEEECKCSDTTK